MVMSTTVKDLMDAMCYVVEILGPLAKPDMWRELEDMMEDTMWTGEEFEQAYQETMDFFAMG